MSRYTGPVWKKSRRLSYSILESGEELRKRQTIPGQHGDAKPKKKTEYGIQMTEKQKLRFQYGLSEKQFRRFFTIAKADKSKSTGIALLILLESRLDNLVYRMGFASTRRQARQLVTHGHVLVNGKKVDIPSYIVELNSIITFKDSSKNLKIVLENVEKKPTTKAFVEVDFNKLEGKYVRYPDRHELSSDVNEAQVIEYYNRKL